MNPVIDKFFLNLLIGSDRKFHVFRHLILWATTIAVISNGFWFLAQKIPSPTTNNKINYCIVSTVFFAAITAIAYFVITRMTRRYILVNFQIGKFFLLLVCVHIASSIVVLGHLKILVNLFTLDRLPQSYAFYDQHIKELQFWAAPYDWVIVWLFSYSLYYNYLLYAVGLKAFKDLFVLKVEKTQLEQENLRLEYSFLKSQLNPHFLFNTLNNIYSFSVTSPARVGDMILKLADLMRYSLYETNEEFVLLSKEVKFLESYISLQRIRHEQEAKIIYSIEGEVLDKKITPLLLVTFLENAFKHGLQSNSQPNWITVSLEIKDHVLTFNVSNNSTELTKIYSGGLGLKNVQKRLDHYYLHRYKLNISSRPPTFNVQLIISLNDRTL